MTLSDWNRRLDDGELSACELARHYLDRIADVEPRVNAVAWLDPETTLAHAERADAARASGARGPLLGLPVSVKDSLETAGMPTTCGSWARSGKPDERDATAVARLRAAGAVVLAKTTVPEYLMASVTESARHGRTAHPRDPARTPGGSSGGEAALIGAGGSPGGLGSDGGVSIRLPSHWCGVVGLRPTAGRVPETGHWPATRATGLLDLTCVGPLASTVDDVELLLHTIAGPDGIDPYCVPAPLGWAADVDVAALRIAVMTDDPLWRPEPPVRMAVEAAANAFADLGCEVGEAAPTGTDEATELFFALAAADGGARARRDLAPAGERLDPNTRTRLEWRSAHAVDTVGWFALLERVHAFRARLHLFFERFDVVLCPVAPAPAPRHDEPTSFEELNTLHTWSVGGAPAVSVPFAETAGLPIGVQLAGRRFEEHVVLAAARALEACSTASAFYARY